MVTQKPDYGQSYAKKENKTEVILSVNCDTKRSHSIKTVFTQHEVSTASWVLKWKEKTDASPSFFIFLKPFKSLDIIRHAEYIPN